MAWIPTWSSDNKHVDVIPENDEDKNDTIKEPKVGMSFSFEEEVQSYHMKYVKHIEFGVHRRNSGQGEYGKNIWFTSVFA